MDCRSLVDGIVSPLPHLRDSFNHLRSRQRSFHRRWREQDSCSFARLEFQHTTAQWMPFQLAAQPNEWGIPTLDNPAHALPVEHTNAVHGVRAGRRRRISDQTRRASGHVGQKQIGHLHIGDRVPGGAHSALVSPTNLPAPIGVQILRNTGRQLRVLRDPQEHHGIIAPTPSFDRLRRQVSSRQYPTVAYCRMEELLGDSPRLGFRRPQVKKVVCAADVSDSDRSDVAKTH